MALSRACAGQEQQEIKIISHFISIPFAVLPLNGVFHDFDFIVLAAYRLRYPSALYTAPK
jgi:hypothetical protein